MNTFLISKNKAFHSIYSPHQDDISKTQLLHRSTSLSATFDDTNLVSAAGLIPSMALAVSTGLAELANRWLTLSGYFGANAGLKVTALVAGMLAGADSIDDMAVLHHGGMEKLFVGTYAPSTLVSFLRAFTFGHARRLDAVASPWLVNVEKTAPIVAGIDDNALVDIDDTIKEVDEYHKRGRGYGHSGVSGLNALIGIVSTTSSAPIIIGSRDREAPGNPSCSTRAGSTRSSPPAPWTQCAPTKPTGTTRSSSKSTPTSKTVPWRTCRRANSPLTPPGWCWPRSRSTSPAPPAARRAPARAATV